MAHITALDTLDVRFPTSTQLDGSDAMNPDPDYSAAYVVLRTDHPDGYAGHGFAFTIGRGNEVQRVAIAALERLVVGRPITEIVGDLGGFARSLTDDSQLRWLGPEKGVMHMAIGAVVNAAWDLAGRMAGKPVWQLVSELSPEQFVDLIDFRYLTDALTRQEALALLRRAEPGKRDRADRLLTSGYPAYTTSPGWLGYSDAKLDRLARRAVADGFGIIKLKVGRDIDEDLRRLKIARAAVGPGIGLAVDANQRWGIDEAAEWISRLGPAELSWVEEPTSPDDILGHAEIRRRTGARIATGEHGQNRILFKQLLQAQAVDVVQIDAARVGGVNENLAILLLAAKFGVPVIPHAGGVGLCELVQHLAMIDYVAVSATMSGRAIEYVDHLHEHFRDPVRVVGGRYLAPRAPGFSAEMLPASLTDYTYPTGTAWRTCKEYEN
ncbi:enolase C-terminal domain-like protein [Nocardia pseudobrasiliensis]|uniref:L-fuconate dehydratase n=1 Tax=Nocardia pseudobrasiliensis TaxID=45979 RepID=A0A370I4J2_9NOCA|nr:enolase C-terminal domain-like protein [Nocardia pseudobrasiliensis]RDI65648.1 L-fuconate dehydratase [Nocardia pseudobrasiliensis]